MDRLAMLEAENATLRDDIAELKRVFQGTDLVLPLEWRLTALETRIVALLIARPRVSKEQFATVFTASEPADLNVIESHISRVRRKLTPARISIRSQRHSGYWIEQEQRRALRAVCREAAHG